MHVPARKAAHPGRPNHVFLLAVQCAAPPLLAWRSRSVACQLIARCPRCGDVHVSNVSRAECGWKVRRGLPDRLPSTSELRLRASGGSCGAPRRRRVRDAQCSTHARLRAWRRQTFEEMQQTGENGLMSCREARYTPLSKRRDLLTNAHRQPDTHTATTVSAASGTQQQHLHFQTSTPGRSSHIEGS